MNKEDRLKLFSNELNDIKNDNLRNFAKELIVNADEYFFNVAASTTGKYHPKFDLGDGGLVRHTRCVEFFAVCEAESRMFSEHETDLLIISAIAHDIKKLGNKGSKYTVENHPQLAADYVSEIREKNKKLISKKDADIICGIVASHMGKWGHDSGLPLPKTDLEKALQCADYIASRKQILDFNFRPTDIIESKNKESKNKENTITESNNSSKKLSDYIITFGKHKGKKLSEIDCGWLEWFCSLDDCFNKEAQELVKKYMHSTKNGNDGNETIIENIEFKKQDESDMLPF